MKAWQYIGDGLPITLNEIDEPEPLPGEVVLDVKGAGMCHTDIGELDGVMSSYLGACPITLGHEVAGVVRSLGDEVTDFAVGERVAVNSTVDGPGTARNGGYQPRVAVQTSLLVRVPEAVTWDQAAVSTDAGMTSYHAVMSRAQVKEGDKVGIIGYGGLGSVGSNIALRAGAQVFVAETNVSLHSKATGAGVTAVSTDIADFADHNLDVIIDFAGFGSTTASAVSSVRSGGRVVQVGLAERFGTLDLIRLTMSEVVLMGSQGGTLEDNQKVLELMATGHLRSETTCIGFEDVAASIEVLRRGENTGRFVVIYD